MVTSETSESCICAIYEYMHVKSIHGVTKHKLRILLRSKSSLLDDKHTPPTNGIYNSGDSAYFEARGEALLNKYMYV